MATLLCGVVRALGPAAVIWGLLMSTPAAPSPPLQNPQALAPFFQALAALQAGQRRHVQILQLGDSLTAGDRFPGRLRALLQGRHGDAGRALMVPGRPFPYYRPYPEVQPEPGRPTLETRGAWIVHDHVRAPDAGAYGLSGTLLEAARDPNDALGPGGPWGLGWTAVPGGIGAIHLDVRDPQAAGTTGATLSPPLVARLDGQPLTLQPAALAAGVVRWRGDAPRPATRLDVELVRPVTLTGWGVLAPDAGLRLDSLGVIGAQATDLARLDAGLVAAELAALEPDLVILAFGTNEGFQAHLDPARYQRQLVAALERLGLERQPLLWVTAPAALAWPAHCRALAPGRPPPESCAVVPHDPAAYHQALLDQDPSVCAAWHPPPMLAALRAVQHRLAQARGWALWDWAEVMGGPCGINRWALADPPLAEADRVHLKPRGYYRSAEMLFDALMAAGMGAGGRQR